MDYRTGHSLEGLHYVASGPETAPACVLVHGSPGSSRDLGYYLGNPLLVRHYHMAAVDRLGFGLSQPGLAEPNLQRQAQALLPVLEALGKGQPVSLLGHSYGGAIVLWLALHYPALVRSAVLLHPLVSPEVVTFQWLRNAGSGLGRRVPAMLKVSTEEMNALPAWLARLADDAHRLERPVRMIQGMRDWLTPKGHADFAQRTYPASYFTVERHARLGHFTPFLNRDFVVEVLRNLLSGT